MSLIITQGYQDSSGTIVTTGGGTTVTSGGYPINHDHLQAFALSAGIVATTDDALDYRRVLASAIAQWERDTLYTPFAATAQTRTYEVPSGKTLDLRGGLVSLASITSSTGNVWVEGQDYILTPRNAPMVGKPYTAVEFSYGCCARSYGFPTITVAGVFGYAAEVPDDVVHAILCLGASMLLPTKTTQVGSLTTLKQDDIELQYSAISAAQASYTAQQNQMRDAYAATVARYRKVVLF